LSGSFRIVSRHRPPEKYPKKLFQIIFILLLTSFCLRYILEVYKTPNERKTKMFIFNASEMVKTGRTIRIDTWMGDKYTELKEAFWEGSAFSLTTPNANATLSGNWSRSSQNPQRRKLGGSYRG
jgi:hypothetical protein